MQLLKPYFSRISLAETFNFSPWPEVICVSVVYIPHCYIGLLKIHVSSGVICIPKVIISHFTINYVVFKFQITLEIKYCICYFSCSIFA